MHLPAADPLIKIRITNVLLASLFCRMFGIWVSGSGAKSVLLRTFTTEAWQEVFVSCKQSPPAACVSAGFLYPPGDYEQAIQHTHQLVSDPGFRRTMAAAARAEVERFGWNAAISRVRNLQYQRAIRIYKAHKR